MFVNDQTPGLQKLLISLSVYLNRLKTGMSQADWSGCKELQSERFAGCLFGAKYELFIIFVFETVK